MILDLKFPDFRPWRRRRWYRVAHLDGHAVVHPLQAGDVLLGLLAGFFQFHHVGFELLGVLVLRPALLPRFPIDLIGIGQLLFGQGIDLFGLG